MPCVPLEQLTLLYCVWRRGSIYGNRRRSSVVREETKVWREIGGETTMFERKLKRSNVIGTNQAEMR